MPPTQDDYLNLWRRALHEPIGIAVSTNQPHALMTNLYEARKAEKEPDYEQISVIFQPVPGEVWLIRKDARGGNS